MWQIEEWPHKTFIANPWRLNILIKFIENGDFIDTIKEPNVMRLS